MCISLQEQIDLVEQRMHTFYLSDQNYKLTEDLSKPSIKFPWLQWLDHIMIHLPQNEQGKTQFFNKCRQYYKKNCIELQVINEFEEQYQPEDATIEY